MNYGVHELSRIDHIPKFVFSNACELGITPDRSEQRDLSKVFEQCVVGGLSVGGHGRIVTCHLL
jgi:hypothetical protein